VKQLFAIPAEMFKQFDDESAGAGRRVEDFNAAITQVLTEMLLAQPVADRIMKRTISPGV